MASAKKSIQVIKETSKIEKTVKSLKDHESVLNDVMDDWANRETSFTEKLKNLGNEAVRVCDEYPDFDGKELFQRLLADAARRELGNDRQGLTYYRKAVREALQPIFPFLHSKKAKLQETIKNPRK